MNYDSYAARCLLRSAGILSNIIGFALLLLVWQIVWAQLDHPTLSLTHNATPILVGTGALIVKHWQTVLVVLVCGPLTGGLLE